MVKIFFGILEIDDFLIISPQSKYNDCKIVINSYYGTTKHTNFNIKSESVIDTENIFKLLNSQLKEIDRKLYFNNESNVDLTKRKTENHILRWERLMGYCFGSTDKPIIQYLVKLS